MNEMAQQMGRGSEILGSIVTWELGGVKVSYSRLVTALQNAGLDESVVRTKLPRNAFTQAAKRLSDERVIDKLNEDDTEIYFQFTKRSRQNGEFEYDKECILVLSKYTGSVFCADNPDLAREAEKLVAEAMDTYTGANISVAIKKLFQQDADIFSFPQDGGVYLVPEAHADFLEKINNFLNEIGGKLSRLPIARGTEHGDRAFRETISASIEKTAKAHLDAIEALTPENQDRSFESRAREINETRYKVEVYAAYLGSEAEKLLKIVAAAKQRLKAKIMEASKNVVVQ